MVTGQSTDEHEGATTMANRNECDRCGVADCDFPLGVDPDMMFERSKATGEILCQACLHDQLGMFD